MPDAVKAQPGVATASNLNGAAPANVASRDKRSTVTSVALLVTVSVQVAGALIATGAGAALARTDRSARPARSTVSLKRPGTEVVASRALKLTV